MAYIYYNPSPTESSAGDCTVRAISKALNVDWEQAYIMLALNGYIMGEIMNANIVWGSLLRQEGFYRRMIPNTCPDCYKIKDFCQDHPDGLYVLGTGSHVVTAINGDYYDAWDSGNEIPLYYWSREG